MTRDRGKYSRFDPAAVYAALDDARASRGATWAAIAREAGVSSSTIQRLHSGGALEADGVLQLVHWLGRRVESFVPGLESQHHAPSERRDRPVGIMRCNTPAIYEALEARRAERGATWRQIADDVGGVSPSSLTRLRAGGRIELSLVMRIADWLDVPIDRLVRVVAQ